jgi:protein-S-isoprenylcysteine O-methyltransferase Ste14
VKQLFAFSRSVIYAPAFIFLFGWIARQTRVFDQEFGFSLPSWLFIPGIIFMVAGGSIVISSISFFIIRGHGTPAPFDPPIKFVATGPYKFVRNPMYVGAFILLTGYGMLLQSLSVILFAMLLVLPVHLFVILYEEPVLKKKFGNSYTEFRKKVHRWIPHF